MQCEVCGNKIFGKSYKVIIERAKLTVCSKCAKLGATYLEKYPSERNVRKVKRSSRITKKEPSLLPNENIELIEDFYIQIRIARERLKLSHEELGRKIGEKVSVLKKIESGKMHPDNKLARKLENRLKIRLITPLEEPKISSVATPQPRVTTIGEVAHIKTRKENSEQ